jgi:hypothetical protein
MSIIDTFLGFFLAEHPQLFLSSLLEFISLRIPWEAGIQEQQHVGQERDSFHQ